MQRVTGRLLSHSFRVVRMDLRGCGRGASLARRTYNGGCSADVRAAAAEIRRWDAAAPLVLIGFSLGGNIALRLAGEAATDPVHGLERVAVLAPPIDLECCAALLALRRNRFYDRYYARALTRQVRQQQRFFPDLPPVRLPRSTTVRLFDEFYTAPRGGFHNALEYYRWASSRPFIPRITVPTFILSARDDPFVAVEPFETLAVPPHVEVHLIRRGGHLGFLGWDGAGGIRWAERRVVDWVTQAG
jgi:predicted alpha/beta-fold hydrolase